MIPLRSKFLIQRARGRAEFIQFFVNPIVKDEHRLHKKANELDWKPSLQIFV